MGGNATRSNEMNSRGFSWGRVSRSIGRAHKASLFGSYPVMEIQISGMAAALRDQWNTLDIDTMPLLDRLGFMAGHQEAVRGDRRPARCCTTPN